jgi:hypothetical protein
MTKEEVLKGCIVDGLVVKLPAQQLDRDLYLEVKKALQLIGGVWKGGKIFGFVFKQDPTEMLKQISDGERRDLKKEYQFFATPDALADRLVAMADIQSDSHTLEPSAGQGAIINAIHRLYPKIVVHCYELMDINQSFLRKLQCTNLLGDDFIESPYDDRYYDRIIANPPFSKNQDIDHIRKMYDCLIPGGILVSVASKHWKLSNNKKEKEFSAWLEELNAEIIELDSGEFKESGTMVGGYIIKIRK